MTNNILEKNALVELAKQWNQLSEEGRDSVDLYSLTKETIRNEHDGAIWDYVDTQEGSSFDAVLEDMVSEVETLAESL